MSEPRAGFSFTHPVQVSLRDLDGLGHVNNAAYLTYLETTRNHYLFDRLGWRQLGDFRFILARTEIDFRSEASFLEVLEVSLRPGRIGSSSWSFEYEIRGARSARLVVEARSVQVWYDYPSRRSLPLPPEVRALLEADRPR